MNKETQQSLEESPTLIGERNYQNSLTELRLCGSNRVPSTNLPSKSKRCRDDIVFFREDNELPQRPPEFSRIFAVRECSQC
jgi:hypothetical protein